MNKLFCNRRHPRTEDNITDEGFCKSCNRLFAFLYQIKRKLNCTRDEVFKHARVLVKAKRNKYWSNYQISTHRIKALDWQLKEFKEFSTQGSVNAQARYKMLKTQREQLVNKKKIDYEKYLSARSRLSDINDEIAKRKNKPAKTKPAKTKQARLAS